MDKLPEVSLVADLTGVAAQVVDMFQQADLAPIGILIHGEDRVAH